MSEPGPPAFNKSHTFPTQSMNPVRVKSNRHELDRRHVNSGPERSEIQRSSNRCFDCRHPYYSIESSPIRQFGRPSAVSSQRGPKTAIVSQSFEDFLKTTSAKCQKNPEDQKESYHTFHYHSLCALRLQSPTPGTLVEEIMSM